MERPIAMIFHRFGPYHCARLRATAALGPAVGVEIVRKDATYRWDVMDRSDGFRRVRLFQELIKAQPAVGELRRRLYRCLNEEKPRAVAIPGWSTSYALLALSWCLETATPTVLMSESTILDKSRTLVAESLKQRLLRLYQVCLAGGSRQIEYLRRLGFPESAVLPGYDVVDNTHFVRPHASDGKGVRTTQSFLVCCRFVPVKNLLRLLEAYHKYRQAAGPSAWCLTMAGDGPEKDKLVGVMKALGLNGCVRFAGYIQYAELPNLYGRAGAFILPSVSEPWGLVTNEAMAAGLPVLVSNRCGCASDLVETGRNGFTFDPCDVDELARLMLRISSMSEEDRTAMGWASREIISRWTPETFATNLMRAVEVALVTSRPKVTLADKALLWALIHRPGWKLSHGN